MRWECIPKKQQNSYARQGSESKDRKASRTILHVVNLGFTFNVFLLSFLEAYLADFAKISPALKERAAQIRLLLMDVDGTMTDGSVTLQGDAAVCHRAV